VVTGEVMARTIGEWRRAESTCRGAILWFFQDLWLGAGWGVVDAAMRPKAAYYIAKRAMQPVALAITDEGNNGLHVSIANDRDRAFEGTLTVTLVRGASTIVANADLPVVVQACGGSTVEIDAMLGRFYDTAYAFRFGPAGHDVVVATLRDNTGVIVAETFHFPLGLPNSLVDELGLVCEARRVNEVVVEISLSSLQFAQSVWLDCGDYRVDDNYFHLAPGAKRVVIARAKHADATFNGFAQPLNAREGVRIGVAADARHSRANEDASANPGARV
jgi:beta-mannosidase